MKSREGVDYETRLFKLRRIYFLFFIFLLPLKLKVTKKKIHRAGYEEMMRLVEQGDVDAIRLKRRAYLGIAILIGGILFEVLLRTIVL